jgi:long-chain fatty acid transport protein
MSKRYFKIVMVLALALAVTTPAWATNGTNLIGIGPTSRAMGGVGVAAPQDPMGAIFANPAAMCFGPYCPGAAATFGGTIFSPTVKSTSTNPGGTASEDSAMKPFIVPAVGITSPITPRLRFGFGAYGFSGMGVDYRSKSPLIYGNLYTKLELMKFAPNLAYQVSDNFSIGGNVSINYQNLDLGMGSSHDYAYGLQLGAIYKLGMFSIGASYATPQSVTHKNVTDFNMGGARYDLELESPAIYAAGIAAAPTDKLLVEFNIKMYPWSSSAGYRDFDWEDQWVYALGVQYKVVPSVALRAGYNYAKNPIKKHDGYAPFGTTNVQGAPVTTANYETFRILGFPAIVEQHITFGLGWEMTEKFLINLSYMHAFEEEISQASAGNVFVHKSSLSEDSLSFDLTWRF